VATGALTYRVQPRMPVMSLPRASLRQTFQNGAVKSLGRQAFDEEKIAHVLSVRFP
jgi:hypothetical protein